MIEKFSFDKQVNTFKELSESRMIDNAHVEEPIVRHSVWSLTIAQGIADTNGHNTTFNFLVVYLYIHLIIETLEDKQDERHDVGHSSGTEDVVGLASEIHHGGNESDIYAIDEIPMAVLTVHRQVVRE